MHPDNVSARRSAQEKKKEKKNIQKILDTRNIAVIILKFEHCSFTIDTVPLEWMLGNRWQKEITFKLELHFSKTSEMHNMKIRYLKPSFTI